LRRLLDDGRTNDDFPKLIARTRELLNHVKDRKAAHRIGVFEAIMLPADDPIHGQTG
jgi:hypothetical protein